jgi:uncharacterized caspase-like protein
LVRLQTAFEAVETAKSVRLVVSDACRVNPLVQKAEADASTQIFKISQPPRGVVVAYSTRPGQEALDGPDDISPYAQAVIETFQQPGMEIDKAFRRINSVVATSTSGKQEPSTLGDWPDGNLEIGPN